MRVVVACDAMAGLSPRRSSEVVAQAFAEAGAQVAVVPLGGGGDHLADALSTMDPQARLVPAGGIVDALDLLSPGDGPLVLDLSGSDVPDLDDLAGAATPEVVEAARDRLGGRRVVAVVGQGQESLALTGLSGALAGLGRERGDDLATTIAADARAEAWAAGLGVDPTAVGTGALGGMGVVFRAVGAEITTGLAMCLDGHDVAGLIGRADVAVTGTAQLDFHAVGGPVVAALSTLAADALRPVVVIAGRTYVSARELRLAGIEAAYPVRPGFDDVEPDAAELLETARRVASTWRW